MLCCSLVHQAFSITSFVIWQEHTVFHFDVNPGALHGALDRFAQFFVSPLCLEDSMQREVMAVDSEFAETLQSDGCRMFRLMCHTVSSLLFEF